MIERFNHFLGRRGEVGLIVSDEQKGGEDAMRRAHSRYRSSGTSHSHIEHVLETPFFVPSRSRMLQIVDVATWFVNRGLRKEAAGLPTPPELARLKPRLDGYPDYVGRGYKIVP